MKSKHLLAALCCALSLTSAALHAADTMTPDLGALALPGAKGWTLLNLEANSVEHAGQKAVRLAVKDRKAAGGEGTGGVVYLDGVELAEGTVEFSAFGEPNGGFGVCFSGQDLLTHEAVYFSELRITPAAAPGGAASANAAPIKPDLKAIPSGKGWKGDTTKAKFVADDWNFGCLSFGPYADSKGHSLEALHFGFDAKAQRKQFADTLSAGGNLMKEAMAGRIYDGSHAVQAGGRFRDGVIEADICGCGRDDFQGIIFRAADEALTSRKFDGEIIYFRPFYANNDNPHYPAIQYFATQRDGVDRRMFASLEKDPKIPKETWFHVRLEVRGTVAKVFLNDAEEPALVVPKLESGRSDGLVGFWGWNGRLANLKITE